MTSDPDRDKCIEAMVEESVETITDLSELDSMLEIDVVCADHHWHDPKGPPFVVAALAQTEEPPPARPWRLKEEMQTGVRKEAWTSPFTQQESTIDVAVPRSDDRIMSTENAQGVSLVCPKHPYAVPLTWAKLVPILDGLVAAGVLRISLQALAARVRK
jgi:hypothetical protein